MPSSRKPRVKIANSAASEASGRMKQERMRSQAARCRRARGEVQKGGEDQHRPPRQWNYLAYKLAQSRFFCSIKHYNSGSTKCKAMPQRANLCAGFHAKPQTEQQGWSLQQPPPHDADCASTHPNAELRCSNLIRKILMKIICRIHILLFVKTLKELTE